jgi:hypothetical protein
VTLEINIDIPDINARRLIIDALQDLFVSLDAVSAEEFAAGGPIMVDEKQVGFYKVKP